MTTIRQLRFLVAVANELNFSRAAEKCHVTQPTLSAGLKELETQLGVMLVERTRRSVRMTSAGDEITERARRILADIAEIEALAAYHGGAFTGSLRLGAIPTVGPYLVPHALPLLRARYPDLKLFLREELTDTLVSGVEEGRLDLALVALPHDVGSLQVEPLFEDGYALATPPDHMLAGRKDLTGQELAEHSLMLLERGHCLQRHALSALPSGELHEDESFSATSLPTLVSMVEEGLGITLLPRLAIDAGAAEGHAIALTEIPAACPRQVVLAWRKSSPHVKRFMAVAKILREARQAIKHRARSDVSQ